MIRSPITEMAEGLAAHADTTAGLVAQIQNLSVSDLAPDQIPSDLSRACASLDDATRYLRRAALELLNQ
jgi:hypothetical protein